MARKAAVVHTVRADERWVRTPRTNPTVVTKATVRVAKGQPKAGTFHGATNLRGTERV